MLIRYSFILILLAHGLIHLIGFAFSLGIAGRPQKSLINVTKGYTTILGIAWLLTSLLFIASAIFYYVDYDFYWITLSLAFIFSQTLIIMYWPSAKYGSVINAIVLIAVVVSTGSYNFNRMVNAEIKSVVAEARHSNEIMTRNKIENLPAVIKRWMIASSALDRKEPSIVNLLQKGALRSTNNAAWSEFRAEQYFSLDPPAFIWKANIQMNDFIQIMGRDKFENGKGNMLIKVESLFPIANSSGKEIDQGTLIRFMAELSWFPQAALKNYIEWKEIDSHHAQATITYGNTSASGIYTFNKEGLPELFEAKRYGDFDGKFSMETWSVKTTRYETFNDIKVGSSSEVTWKLSTGDFTWLKLDVIQLNYSY